MKILIAGLLAVCAYFLWQYYFAEPKEQPPIERLLLYMDGHVNEILGPLPLTEKDALPAPAYTHQLRVLRDDIRAMQATVSSGEERRYAAAIKLCDALISATDERNKHIVRINDARAKNNPSALATNPEEDRKKRRAFFEHGIALSWSETSRRMHKVIDGYYKQLRKFDQPARPSGR